MKHGKNIWDDAQGCLTNNGKACMRSWEPKTGSTPVHPLPARFSIPCFSCREHGAGHSQSSPDMIPCADHNDLLTSHAQSSRLPEQHDHELPPNEGQNGYNCAGLTTSPASRLFEMVK